MRYFWIVVFSTLLSVVVNAQEVVDYQLDIPTMTEFVEALPDFSTIDLSPYSTLSEEQGALGELIRTAETEFLWRYADQANLETLLYAFEKLKLPVYCSPPPRCSYILPVIDYGFWFQLILEAWLRENSIDFDSTHSFQFADFTVEIERRDFSGDGQHEWILELIKQQHEIEYAHYFVVSQSPQGYQLSSVPLDGTIHWWRHGVDEQPLREIGFEDINADGIPEWIFDWTWAYVSPAGVNGGRNAIILSWREDELVTLARIRDLQEIANIDADSASEIIAGTDYIGDYWGCGTLYQYFYDWDGEYYQVAEPQATPFDCTARYAEDAMWAWDFTSAIQFYDTFLSTNRERYAEFRACDPNYDCGMNRMHLIYEYFQVRRILAHALLGNSEIVESLLTELGADSYQSSFAQAILRSHSNNAETLCFAAYTYYVEEHPFFTDLEQDKRFYPGVARLDDGNYTIVSYNIPVDPLRAGCDIRFFSGEATAIPTSTWTPFPMPMSPTPDLRSQAEIWTDEQDFHAAFLNGDFEIALLIAQMAVPKDEFDTWRWGYYRALTLEALVQVDEALVEYTAIYEQDPASAWGILASIHLEQIPEETR